MLWLARARVLSVKVRRLAEMKLSHLRALITQLWIACLIRHTIQLVIKRSDERVMVFKCSTEHAVFISNKNS